MQTIQRDMPERAVQGQSGILAAGKMPQSGSQDGFAAYFSQTQRAGGAMVGSSNIPAPAVIRSGSESVKARTGTQETEVPKPAQTNDAKLLDMPDPAPSTEVKEEAAHGIEPKIAAIQATSDSVKMISIISKTSNDGSAAGAVASLNPSSTHLLVTPQAKVSVANTKPVVMASITLPKSSAPLHKGGLSHPKDLDANVAIAQLGTTVAVSPTGVVLPMHEEKETAKLSLESEQTTGERVVLKAVARSLSVPRAPAEDSSTLAGVTAPLLDTEAVSQVGTAVTQASPAETSRGNGMPGPLTQVSGEHFIDAHLSVPNMFHSQQLQPAPGTFAVDAGGTDCGNVEIRSSLSVMAEMQGSFSEIGTNRHQLEVGFHDETLGWLSVRTALGDEGTLHASVAGTNRMATHALGEMLPGLDGYLRQHAVELTSLSVARPESALVAKPESGTGLTGSLDGGGGNTGAQQSRTARNSSLPNETESERAVDKFTQPLSHNEPTARTLRAGARVDIRI